MKIERENALAIDGQGVSLRAKSEPGFRAREMVMRQLLSQMFLCKPLNPIKHFTDIFGAKLIVISVVCVISDVCVGDYLLRSQQIVNIHLSQLGV